MAESGKLSAAVYDTKGRMVRPMLYGQLFAPGKDTLSWNELDRYGDPAKSREFEWRTLRTQEFTREFLINVGINTS